MTLISWDDFLQERKRREDEYVARKFQRFAYLGRGHMRADLCQREMERQVR